MCRRRKERYVSYFGSVRRDALEGGYGWHSLCYVFDELIGYYAEEYGYSSRNTVEQKKEDVAQYP